MPLATLYYVYDPMCSWCWGFRPVWSQVQQALAGKVNIEYVLGGLAADSDLPMPADMQLNIKDTWQRIQHEIPGTVFNFDFWTRCQPRRSTYPSCRAVIAAGLQGVSNKTAMLSAIQEAYYLHAENPSSNALLIQLADKLGLDSKRFNDDLSSAKCESMLQQQLQLTRTLGVSSFPGLVANYNGTNTLIYIDYTSSDNVVSSIMTCLQAHADLADKM